MKYCVFLSAILFVFTFSSAQDTFSIVALDSVTGEVGSAGASCLDNSVIAGGAYIISDVIPGLGAIHTQSFYLSQNQQNANFRMRTGQTPQQIIDWLILNDAQGDSTQRQYGIVAFVGNGSPESAAFTGSNCFDFKSHRLGKGYAIQGNILLGAAILDSMEARFLREPGPLANRLMAALQGANVPGADSRCLNEGVSSQSAFIRVAKPNDTPGNFYLDINVAQTPFGAEPIDSVQAMFDLWQTALSVAVPLEGIQMEIIRYPSQHKIQVTLTGFTPRESYQLSVYDLNGREINTYTFNQASLDIPFREIGAAGVYALRLSTKGTPIRSSLFMLNK